MRRMIRNLAVLFPHGVIRWLLRDEFSDTRAAGAVNGTPATPGPGTRTVTDTDNKLTIGGGVANFAPNTVPADGDPGLWYGAVARVAGRVLLFRANWAVRGWSGVGFDTNQVGAISELSFVSDNANLLRFYEGGLGYNWWSLLAATNYDLALVVGTVGGCFFIRSAGVWLLEWTGRLGNTATLYPGIQSNAATFAVDYIRIPDALWLPTPLAYDIFARADGALGSSEIWGPDNQIVTARVWNNRVGTTLVATTAAQASALVGGVAIATVNTGTVNAITGATLTRAGNEVGVVLRYVDADNYIRAIHDGTNCKLIKRVAAAETDVISAVVALGAGAIRVIPDGTAFRLFLNDAAVGVVSTINDAVLQTGTEQGLFSTNVGNTQDRFLVMARGSNGEYAALNKWSF